MKDSFKYFISVFLYGTLGLFLSLIDVNSDFVVFSRGFIGALFILFIKIIRKDKFDFKAIKDNLLYLAICGISLGLNEMFLFIGYKYAVSLASLGNYTAPISVIVISAILYKEKLNIKQVLCVIASFLGIVLISGIFSNNEVDIRSLLYGLLASIGFIFLVFFNKKLGPLDPLDKTFIQLLFTAITVLPFVFINKSIPSVFDIKTIAILLMLGILHTGFAYILYFDAIKTLAPIKIALIGYVEPVLSVLIGALLLNEKMDIFGILGTILIIGSAIISELLGNK